MVSTEVHPTTHPVSIRACWTILSNSATPKYQIIGMVTTAVLLPAWHVVHGIGTLTHLCQGVWCVMSAYVIQREAYMWYGV